MWDKQPERSDNLVDAVNPVPMPARKKQTLLGFRMANVSHHLMRLGHSDDNAEGEKKIAMKMKMKMINDVLLVCFSCPRESGKDMLFCVETNNGDKRVTHTCTAVEPTLRLARTCEPLTNTLFHQSRGKRLETKCDLASRALWCFASTNEGKRREQNLFLFIVGLGRGLHWLQFLKQQPREFVKQYF